MRSLGCLDRPVASLVPSLDRGRKPGVMGDRVHSVVIEGSLVLENACALCVQIATLLGRKTPIGSVSK
jgi:hypothetical protein